MYFSTEKSKKSRGSTKEKLRANKKKQGTSKKSRVFFWPLEGNRAKNRKSLDFQRNDLRTYPRGDFGMLKSNLRSKTSNPSPGGQNLEIKIRKSVRPDAFQWPVRGTHRADGRYRCCVLARVRRLRRSLSNPVLDRRRSSLVRRDQARLSSPVGGSFGPLRSKVNSR